MVSKSAIVIDTRADVSGAQKGFQAIINGAKKLAAQYSKTVDSLTKEEAELDKLKNKLDLIMSGNTTPASIKAMESELKKTTKEAENLKKQLDSMEVDIDTKNEGLSMTRHMYGEDSLQYRQELASRDALLQKDIELGQQYDDLTSKAQTLSEKIQQAKMDPSTTIEAQELANKIELTKQNLERGKEEANGLKDKLASVAKLSFASALSKGANSVKSGFEAIGSKIDKLKSKITKLALTAMVFSVIRNSLNNLRKDLGAMLISNDQFANSLNQIKSNLATAFAPIYNAILPALNALMSALSVITGTIATFIATLFGQTASQAQANAKALQDQKNATEDLAKAQGKLASFDNLEVNDASSSSGSGAGGIDFSQEIQTDPKIMEWLNNIKQTLATLFEPLKTAWDNVGSEVIASAKYAFDEMKKTAIVLGNTFLELWNSDLGVSICERLLEIWQEINLFIGNVARSIREVEETTGKAKKMMESLLKMIEKVLKLFRNVAKSLREWALSKEFQKGIEIIEGIFTNIFDTVGGIADALAKGWEIHGLEILKGVQGILNDIGKVAEDVSGIIAEWTMSEEFQSAVERVGGLLGTWVTRIREIADWIVAMYEQYLQPVVEENIIPAINKVISRWLTLQEKIQPGIDFIVGLLETVLEPAIAAISTAIGVIAEVFGSVAEIIENLINGDIFGALESLKSMIEGVWNRIISLFGGIATWFSERVIQPITGFFSGMWDKVKEGASAAWEGIKNVFGSVANWFKDVFQKAWEGVKQVFSTGAQIFSGIKEGIENTFKTVVNGIISGLNTIISTPFNTINGILNGIRNIGILDIKPFQGLWGYNPLAVPQIPRLATGGVAYAPMVAQIGEYAGARTNPEIVTPESLMRQIVREESNGNKDVVIDQLTVIAQIGEEVLSRQVVKAVRLEEQKLGKPLFAS